VDEAFKLKYSMTPLKKRLLFYACLLLFLVVDRFAGRYLFGEAQSFVEITCIYIAGFSVFFWLLSPQQRAFRKRMSEVKEHKRALLALLRAKEREKSKSCSSKS
jgi:hypothetical protein